MKIHAIPQICNYCQKSFTANRTSARYCSGTCKTYASQERTGRRKTISIQNVPENLENRESKIAGFEAELQRLPMVKKQIEQELEATEKQISNLKNQLKAFTVNLEQETELLNQVESTKKKIPKLKTRLDGLVFEEARIKQEIFDLRLPKMWNDGRVNGKEIALFSENRVRYNFENLERPFNLRALGNPVRPFILYICEGDDEYAGHLVSVMDMVGEVAKCTDAKILICIDRQMMARNFEKYLKENSLDRESITLAFVENRAEIEAVFEEGKYEFIVFPDLSIFNLDYDFLLSLIKKHPRTSIFCASEKPMKDFLQHNRLNIRLKTGYDDERANWGGILVTPHSDFLFDP